MTQETEWLGRALWLADEHAVHFSEKTRAALEAHLKQRPALPASDAQNTQGNEAKHPGNDK